MSLIIYPPTPVAVDTFVAYWGAVYPQQEDLELYTPHIGNCSAEALRHLFNGKFGARFAVATSKSVQANVIPRLAELNALPEDLDAAAFLRLFSKGGAIFRIFLLHCWRPNRFPIYDQHVHRAMSVVESGRCEEIETWSDAKKIASYVKRYLVFHKTFCAWDQRLVDRALWAFGRFIKTAPLPGACRSSRSPTS